MAKKSPTRKTTSKAPTKKSTTKKVAAPKKPASRAGKKPTTQKTASNKVAAKKAPVKKAAAKKPTAKKPVAPVRGKKPASRTQSVSTENSVKSTPSKKSTAKKVSAKSTVRKTTATAKTTKKTTVKKSRLSGKSKAGKAASIGFSLDEVKEIAKASAKDEKSVAENKAAKAKDKAAAIEAQLKAAKPAKVAAASLADILGFNPAGPQKKSVYDDPSTVPAKWRKYFKLLIELRTHLTGQIDQHAEQTLKRSSKDDAGDLSSYGQHMADAGTDTFDRDFALSLVANEQEALSEIEAAITRIKNGSYGICEVTGKPIDKDRLAAVPFTRYSADAQKELERNRHRVRTQAGLGAEAGDTVAIADPNADD